MVAYAHIYTRVSLKTPYHLGKMTNLPVFPGGQPPLERERFGRGIAAIQIDSREDAEAFLFRHKLQRSRRSLIGKGSDEPIAQAGG